MSWVARVTPSRTCFVAPRMSVPNSCKTSLDWGAGLVEELKLLDSSSSRPQHRFKTGKVSFGQ